jgi:DeoR/GlpR family transcriptional regulator of sugar metabolism
MRGDLLVDDRTRQIIDLLHRNGELSVQELSDLLGVSTSSVRRDLAALKDHRFIQRIHGGVRLSTIFCDNHLPIYKLPVDPKEARAIADRAVQHIKPGEVIGVSGGLICTQLALRLRLLEGITIVTNALNVATELVALPGIQVRVIGGRLNSGSFELVGRALELSLSGVHIDKFFLGTDGLSLQFGVTGHNEAEAMAARVIMEHSDTTIILADSSKFKKASFAQVAPISAVGAIVTTDQVSQGARDEFEMAGVRIMIATCS